jgi:hypothetical protein
VGTIKLNTTRSSFRSNGTHRQPINHQNRAKASFENTSDYGRAAIIDGAGDIDYFEMEDEVFYKFVFQKPNLFNSEE